MSAALKTPSREDFAAMLDESFSKSDALEGSVLKGRVVAIEKDMAVIDVGLKTEGRVALREFTGPGREGTLSVGDERVRERLWAGSSERRVSQQATGVMEAVDKHKGTSKGLVVNEQGAVVPRADVLILYFY